MFAQTARIGVLMMIALAQGCSHEVMEEVDTSEFFSGEAWGRFTSSTAFRPPQARTIFLTEQLTRALHTSGRNHLSCDQLSKLEFDALKELLSLCCPQRLQSDDFDGLTIFIQRQPPGYYDFEIKSDETIIYHSNTSVTWVD
ncbi:hypothetical protein [Schlesneria sp. DSM 10557]|uniref:hypothetical protein n=1 Tax=Schlesneria sp. DSM 10557 TaxID=3044399 RepID=UPI0035A0879D